MTTSTAAKKRIAKAKISVLTRPLGRLCPLAVAGGGVALAVLLAVTSCTRPNPNFCDEDSDCDTNLCDRVTNACITPLFSCPPRANASCPEPLPICGDNGVCRGCADSAECAATDTTAPICLVDGSCSACASDSECAAANASLPLCTTSGTCIACRVHADCASEVCDTDAHTCTASGEVIYVDNSTGSAASTCTQADPCKTIGHGLAQVTNDRHIIIVRATGMSYTELLVMGGMTVQIRGTGARLTAPVSPSDMPVVRVSNGADVTIEGLTMGGAHVGTNGHGVLCSNVGGASTVRLLQATLENNTGAGLSAMGCTIEVRQSTIRGNADGGITLSNGAFTIENNVIVKNGSTMSELGGVRIENAAHTSPQVFRFNTVADNAANTGASSSGVECTTTTPMTASSSIVYNNAAGGRPALAGNCSWTYSDINGSGPAAGMGNIDADPLFVSPGTDNYHLDASSFVINAANPASTITTDIDGDARPLGSGYDMGADEVK